MPACCGRHELQHSLRRCSRPIVRRVGPAGAAGMHRCAGVRLRHVAGLVSAAAAAWPHHCNAAAHGRVWAASASRPLQLHMGRAAVCGLSIKYYVLRAVTKSSRPATSTSQPQRASPCPLKTAVLTLAAAVQRPRLLAVAQSNYAADRRHRAAVVTHASHCWQLAHYLCTI